MGVQLRNDEPCPYDSIHSWFGDTAARYSSARAVSDDCTVLTYGELDTASNAVATLLADSGVRPGSLVALRVPRSVVVPVAILGILKHGCAYVPIDPAYPQQRSDLILADSAAAFTLACDADGEFLVTSLGPAVDLEAGMPPRLAYVIYTSGSTGTPKGTLVGHDQILALMHASSGCYDFGAEDVWTMFSSYSFDFSVWEMWGALLFGGELVVVPTACAQDPRRFAELLETANVTVLNQVPTAFTYLVRSLEATPRKLAQLRYVVFGGEEINASTIRQWWQLGIAPQAQLINMYGITETTVHVTHVELTPSLLDVPGNGTPIGHPLPHLAVSLLDESGQHVLPGTPGEIVVTGQGVSFGYLRRPDMTSQRFRIVPGTADLAYHSGDWGIQDDAGLLRYLGRRDAQVQIRGHRIELAEVEAAVLSHPHVRACAVTAPKNAVGEPVLTAHVSTETDASVSVADVRRHLSLLLPNYLVPGRIVRHAELPRTASGKVDRSSLDG
ncbi:amino acid adenylation domain-containing protein [Longispora sp. NPDC051575]|uniref:amino acid adenylation domain-containing protein n=1 Tax=Longispora sp. NPDC051575 TaxID=3154943 RepID=UPI0034349DD9